MSLATLQPNMRSHGLPPLRFRLKPFLELSLSFSEALIELEEKYARPRVLSLQTREELVPKKRPR